MTIGQQPVYDDISLVERLSLMIDFFHPRGHQKLSPEALATVISQEYLRQEIRPDTITRFLNGDTGTLPADVRNAICDLMKLPRDYLAEEETTDAIRQLTVQLQIVIEMRDRGVNYIAGRAGSVPQLGELLAVLDAIRLIPTPASDSPAADTPAGDTPATLRAI